MNLKLEIKGDRYVIKDNNGNIKEEGKVTKYYFNPVKTYLSFYENDYKAMSDEEFELEKIKMESIRGNIKYKAELPLVFEYQGFSVHTDLYKYEIIHIQDKYLIEKGSTTYSELVPKIVNLRKDEEKPVLSEIEKKLIDYIMSNKPIGTKQDIEAMEYKTKWNLLERYVYDKIDNSSGEEQRVLIDILCTMRNISKMEIPE